MSIRAYVIIAALAGAVVGFLCLFTDVDVTLASGGKITCGSISSPNGRDARVADLTDAFEGGRGQTGGSAKCDDALSSRKGWVIPLLIGSLVIAGGAAVTRKERPAASTDTATA